MLAAAAAVAPTRRATRVGRLLIRGVLILIAVLFVFTVVVLPLGAVLIDALRAGVPAFIAAVRSPDSAAAIRLTLFAAAIAVPLNVLFGIAAAWSIAKFEWRGKSVLLALIDLPLTVSPVIAGMSLVLLFGARGWFGPTLASMDVKIIFAAPGIVLATAFVTVPFVARELIPLMQSQSAVEEEAALSLGASGWSTFFRVTLPNIRWGLVYGTILCAARSIGEFGAVSVVSGHIRGETETVPLHIETLFGEYQFGAASALASLLVTLTVLAVVLRQVLEVRKLHVPATSS